MGKVARKDTRRYAGRSRKGARAEAIGRSSGGSKVGGTKAGFTLVEVMLVLGITGLMVIGLMAGLFSSINGQRYNDAVRSFAEELRSIYNETIRPEGLGLGNSGRAILGKVVVFDPEITNDHKEQQFYTATIIGRANINLTPVQASGSLLEELKDAEASLYCGSSEVDGPSTAREYAALWQTRFMAGRSNFFETEPTDEFRGTFIIARSPASNVVHTAYSKDIVYNLKERCNGESQKAEEDFAKTLSDEDEAKTFYQDKAVDICIESDQVKYVRAVRVAADGRNSSAISVLNADELEEGEENPCL